MPDDTPPRPAVLLDRAAVLRAVESALSNGAGQRGTRFVITDDFRPGSDLGGWCAEALADQLCAQLGVPLEWTMPDDTPPGLTPEQLAAIRADAQEQADYGRLTNQRSLVNSADVTLTLLAEIDRLTAVVGSLAAALGPFARLTPGIPDNWPGPCVLVVRDREDEGAGRVGQYLGYVRRDPDGRNPTIDDYRRAAVACESLAAKPNGPACSRPD